MDTTEAAVGEVPATERLDDVTADWEEEDADGAVDEAGDELKEDEAAELAVNTREAIDAADMPDNPDDSEVVGLVDDGSNDVLDREALEDPCGADVEGEVDDTGDSEDEGDEDNKPVHDDEVDDGARLG